MPSRTHLHLLTPTTMSLTDLRILPRLYDGLATPPLSPTDPTSTKTHAAAGAVKRRTSLSHSRRTSFAHSVAHTVSISPPFSGPGSPISTSALGDIPEPSVLRIPPPAHPLIPVESHSFSRSLQPSRIPHLAPLGTNGYSGADLDHGYLHLPPVTPDFLATADSLTREKKGKMPALSHLLSVGNGRVLALAADERYVYAGCQSADNEVMVSCISICSPVEEMWSARFQEVWDRLFMRKADMCRSFRESRSSHCSA